MAVHRNAGGTKQGSYGEAVYRNTTQTALTAAPMLLYTVQCGKSNAGISRCYIETLHIGLRCHTYMLREITKLLLLLTTA